MSCIVEVNVRYAMTMSKKDTRRWLKHGEFVFRPFISDGEQQTEDYKKYQTTDVLSYPGIFAFELGMTLGDQYAKVTRLG